MFCFCFSDFSKITFWDLLEAINLKPIPILDGGFSEDLNDFVTQW